MEKNAIELKGTRVVARVKPHNIRFPRSGHQPGDYAIVIFDVLKVLEGELPSECHLPGGQIIEYQFTGVGNMPKINLTSDYIFQGVLVIDKKWGEQYQMESMRLDYDLSKEVDQRKFFSYFMTDRQVDILFEAHKSPIILLEQKNIGELIKIKGIGPATAARMCLRFEDCKDNGRAYVALKGLELSKHAIDMLVKRYGSADVVIDKIESNPYILIKEMRGYGWLKADAIAQKQGFTRDCKERVLAYMQYYLEAQADTNGNSWVTIEDLLINVSAECSPVSKENLTTWIKENMADPKAFLSYYNALNSGEQVRPASEMPLLFYDPETRHVGLFTLRLLEKQIARHIQRLRDAPASFKYDKNVCEGIIKQVETDQGFEYTDEQMRAIWQILDNNIAILTGSAGTGKTFTLTAVAKIFQYYGLHVDQCALSGRASSNMSEITKVGGKTIHRLLSFVPDYERFAFNERNPLHSDVVVLDEASMVGGDLFLALVSAIRSGAKFIMVGDFHQLESIGLCNILKDCLTSGYVKSTTLTKIHRQAARSGIISQSLRVCNGEPLVHNDFVGSEIRGELEDFKIIGSYDSGLVQYNIVQEFKKLYINQRIPIEDIQIIVPMRTRGDISCRVLNEIIQNIVNPSTSLKDVYVDYLENGTKYRGCFKPKDRIIVIRNNYHAMGSDGKEKQIFNGNVGYIKDLSEDTMIINLAEQGDIILTKDNWNNIQLAYAITVHKKQGDSVPYAILGFDTSCYALYSKELLYTAITRASKYCTLIAQSKALNAAVKISRVRLKQTWLKEDLFNLYISEQEKKGHK